MTGAAATVEPNPELPIYTYNTDTVQERKNITEYTVENVTLENGTVIQNRTFDGWHYEQGDSTYYLDVKTWQEGSIRQAKLDVVIQLTPNNLTKLLDASKDPWKSIDNRTQYFNEHYYFNQSNITQSEFQALENEITDFPIYLDGEEVKSSNIKDKPKNVTVKVRSNTSQTIKIGSHSTVVATSGGVMIPMMRTNR